MSNRRRPKVLMPLDGGAPPAPRLPWPLDHIEWTDQPPAKYPPRTLEWIAAAHRDAGRLNVWLCETCGVGVLCVDEHPGVTPMMVSHHTLGDPDCAGMCASQFYRRDKILEYAPAYRGHTNLEPTYEWYRPSEVELRGENAEVRGHVYQGGLLVRAVAS